MMLKFIRRIAARAIYIAQGCDALWDGWQLLQRATDLKGLILWARRKHLAPVAEAYQVQLYETLIALQGYGQVHPRLANTLYWLYTLWEVIRPPRTFYPGWARDYRRVNL